MIWIGLAVYLIGMLPILRGLETGGCACWQYCTWGEKALYLTTWPIWVSTNALYRAGKNFD